MLHVNVQPVMIHTAVSQPALCSYNHVIIATPKRISVLGYKRNRMLKDYWHTGTLEQKKGSAPLLVDFTVFIMYR